MHVTLDRFKARSYQLPLIKAFTRRETLKFIALWPRRCLAGDTHITLANGSWKFLKDIVPGDKVLSWNGKAFVSDIVKHAWKTEVKETVKVRAYGHSVISSEDHLFLADDDTRTFWERAIFADGRALLVHTGESKPRKYHCSSVRKQEPQELYDIETEINHNFIANGFIVHNSGKDICAWNLMIREALRVKGNYWYVWPSFAQARRGMWETITNTGETFFDYIPKQLIVSKHDSLMRLTLINNSIIRLVGSENVDSLRGANLKGIIFSEASIQRSGCYTVLQPIVAANPGAWMLFVTTPFGKNHFYDLYQGAIRSPDWWVQKLTLNDTKHVQVELLEKELAEGSLTSESIQAEYYCSFERGIEGSVYGVNMHTAKREGRIGHVPYNRAYPVHTAIDIGFTDHSAVIFFQVIDDSIKIIDAFQKNKEPLEYYVKQIKSKEYNYGRHFAPHDLRNASFSTGLTRLNHASQLGLDFEIVPSLTIMDGIDHCRRIFNRIWIDKDKCRDLIDALENYRFKWDPETQIYGKPIHNQYSHMADSFRMLAISIQGLRDSSSVPSAEDLSAIEERVRYNRSTFSDPFKRK